MGKDWMRFLTCLLVVAALPAQEERPTCDLGGAVGGSRGERVRVTVWHDDGARCAMKMLAEGFADDSRTFSFEAVPWLGPREWGQHKVIVVARSKTRVGLTEVRGANADTDNVYVAMHKQIDVRGVLIDRSSGKPIEGAWIWPSIFTGERQVWATEPLLPWRAETDAEGRFVLRGLPEGVSLKAIAGGPEHARTWLELGTASDKHRFGLQRGGVIQGRVLRPDGRPAARVQVETTSAGAGRGHTTTDDEGRFRLTSLEEGVYKVWAEVPDLTVVAALDLQVRPGEVTESPTVQLVRGGFIVGRVVDDATGAPIVVGPHTDVAMYGPARGDGGSCECTPVLADGTFRIRAPAGTNRIYLRAATGYSEPSEHVDVRDGEETEVVWRVKRTR